MDLAAVLAPITIAELLRDHWQRRPLYIPGTPDKLAPLFDRAAFDRAVAAISSDELGRRAFVKAGSQDAAGDHVELRIQPEQIPALVRAGMTIQAEQLETAHAGLRGLLADARQQLAVDAAMDVGAFLSPDGAGYGLHFDATGMFTLQIAGAKRWWYGRSPAIAFPLGNRVATRGARDQLASDDLDEVTLHPGDILYLPPGTWHRARAIGESLHVSLTVRAATLVERVGQLLEPLLIDPRWRRLPEPDDDLAERLRELAAAILAWSPATLRREPLPAAPAAPPRTWQPVLDGAAREAAASAARDIVGALRAVAPPDPSLASGAAGMAVCAAYLDDEAALPLWQASADALAGTAMSPSLFRGVTGIGWVTAHLRDRLFAADDDDPCAAVDEFVLDRVSHPGFGRPFDLGDGLVGFGIYALERLPAPLCAQILAQIVERLGEIVEPAGPGGRHLAIRTPPRELIPLRRAQFPGGWFNLGLAHGVPGVVALLAGIRAAVVRPAEAAHLLDALVGWLLAHARPGAPSRYPHWVGDAEPDRTQLAWCYGDLGIAAALHHAGVACARAGWCTEALGLARAAARRSLDSIPVLDAGLCHGAIGAAHGFARLHHLTGDAELRRAAADWYGRALALRGPGGIAGWRAFQGEQPGGDAWSNEPGLLTGAAGIALSLHAAATAIEPRWDRALLWSMRGC
ncbi:MAG: hypothetical protein E6J90_44790 [Deltaproteobacteria bacterium]|nr:MAG: hypothetical protein E6J90_44790 [Deltaproteobacteria bacterium]TMQ22528.1 MAG: hypothetical protein E6J91_01245 [Deltaproteobacteria bacterium]